MEHQARGGLECQAGDALSWMCLATFGNKSSKWHKCLFRPNPLLCLPSNPSFPAFLRPHQPRRKDNSGKLLATIWQQLPGDIGLALRFNKGNLLHVVLVSLDGRSVASTCATTLCSNADRSSSARPARITDVPNSAAIARPMRHNGSSRWQRGLMLGACFLALQVHVAEESGKQDHA